MHGKSKSSSARVLNACYHTPFFNAGQNTCLKKVCQRHFSFDVSMHKSDSDAHSLTCCFETVMKNKGEKRENEGEKKDDDDKGIYV